MKRTKLHSKLILLFLVSCVGLLAADVPIVPPSDSDAAPGFYSVTELADQIQLNTPYGTINVPTGFGANVPYRFSIPIEALKKGAPPALDLAKALEKASDGTPASLPLSPTGLPVAGPVPAASPAPTTVIVDDGDALVVEANRLFNRRRYYEALTVVDQLLRKRPVYTRGWLMKGSLLHVQGHKDLALKAWNKAKEIEPENPEILAVLERYQ